MKSAVILILQTGEVPRNPNRQVDSRRNCLHTIRSPSLLKMTPSLVSWVFRILSPPLISKTSPRRACDTSSSRLSCDSCPRVQTVFRNRMTSRNLAGLPLNPTPLPRAIYAWDFVPRTSRANHLQELQRLPHLPAATPAASAWTPSPPSSRAATAAPRIVPGDPDENLLMKAISHTDPNHTMPRRPHRQTATSPPWPASCQPRRLIHHSPRDPPHCCHRPAAPPRLHQASRKVHPEDGRFQISPPHARRSARNQHLHRPNPQPTESVPSPRHR